MDSSGPLQGLFPESNNIQVASSQNESVSGTLETSTDDDNVSTPANSIDTNVLKFIMNENSWHDIEGYQEHAANQRFYLSELYTKNKHVTTNKMADKNSSQPIYGNANNDFANYNRKIQREYELRDKLEGLLRQQESGDVKILNESSVYEHFSAGDDLSKNRTNKKYEKLKHAALSLLKTRLPRLKDRKVTRKEKYLDQLSKSSTCVIDDASHGNMAIDEGNAANNKREMTDTSESSDMNITTKSNDRKSKFCSYVEQLTNRSVNSQYHVQRKLRVRHIQMISIGSCLSVGIFLTSGKAFSVAGPFGTLLGFALTGSIVLATLLSFTELSTLIPVSSGFSGLASRFVEDAFGFALGWTYWFSCMIALPAQVVASTFYLSYYKSLDLSEGPIAGFVTLFFLYPIVINLMDVRLMGEVVYLIGLLKILIAIAMILAMVILNAGHGGSTHKRVGFRYWDKSKSVYDLTYGLFRPSFDLSDTGDGSLNGISGPRGRFLAVASVMLISTFAYSGVEMTFLASGEAINPKKTIPSAIKRTFCIVLVIYMFTIFSVGINIYSGDPRLLSYFSGSSEERYDAAVSGVGTNWQLSTRCKEGTYTKGDSAGNGYSSPWVLALQNFGLCTFASVFNGILVFFTTGAEISSLFSSSRTLYAMSVQCKAPSIFQRCSKRGVPYVSVIFSGIFGVIAYLAVDNAAVENFDVLANISSASTSIIWMGLNISFLRFYYALKTRDDIISRDDVSYPYRSPLQPYLSFYGLFGCTLFVLFMGYTNFINTYWNTKSFFSAYGGLMLFAGCYAGYKIIGTSKIQRLDQLDMDTGRREMDRVIWDEYRQYSGPYRERIKKLFTWLY